MRLVTATQRTPEWYQSRLGKVTGSRIKDMIAYSKRGVFVRDENGKFLLDEAGERIQEFPELEARAKYRRQLVTERIYGQAGVEEVYINDAMKWGMMNEDIARTQYKLATGYKVSEEGFCILERNNPKTGKIEDVMAGCSTDGLVDDINGNLEIKNLTPSNHLYEIVKENQLPDQFKDQVQFQLFVTGRHICHFVGYDSRAPKGIDILAVEVERDEDYIGFLEAEMYKFLDEVDREFKSFLKYLPVAERVCKECGVIFTDQLNICPACFSNLVKITKILKSPEISLLNNVMKQK
jgi:predicted Zn-ribbon and HTH transcriptional regulator